MKHFPQAVTSITSSGYDKPKPQAAFLTESENNIFLLWEFLYEYVERYEAGTLLLNNMRQGQTLT
jgi:hypothetical protein